MFRARLLVAMAGICSLALTSTASIQAGILVESTFDDDDEGWTTGDFFASTGANTALWIPQPR